jgi:hypothetical protein
VFRDLRCAGFHFVGELRQRAGVALGELADAAGERLRDTVELALHCGGEGVQPLIVNDEGLDLVFAEVIVFGLDLGGEFFLSGLELGPAAEDFSVRAR